jgi:hypothetical protein
MDIDSIVLLRSLDGVYSDFAEFTLRDTTGISPYIIRNITGVDADEIVPRFSGVGGSSGNKFFNMRLKSRQIAISLILNPNYSIGNTPSTLRDRIYSLISSYKTSKIGLAFHKDDAEVSRIYGFITKIESDLNTLMPEVKITVYCEDPYFRSPQRFDVNLQNMSKTAPVIGDYASSAPHGFRMAITATGSFGQFRIRKTGNFDWNFTINFGFDTGDSLFISSEENDRYVQVNRPSLGVTYNLISAIAVGSEWPIIFPGENAFNINTSSYNYQYVDYYQTYWGL